MNDHHERFIAWLEEGAPGEPARDLAMHAHGCESCRRSIDALDALAATDVGAITPPRIPAGRAGGWVGAHRRQLIAAGTTVAAAALMLVVVLSALLGRDGGLGFILPTPVPSEGTLAGNPPEGGESASSSVAATAAPTTGTSAGNSGSPTQPGATEPAVGGVAPSPRPGTGPVAPIPTPIVPEPTIGPASPGPTAAPTIVVTPSPTVAATAQPTTVPTPPPPTPTPTPVPTAEPTPMPTPTLEPACADGLDNDGDLFTDWPLDLGCASPDDDDEGGPIL